MEGERCSSQERGGEYPWPKLAAGVKKQTLPPCLALAFANRCDQLLASGRSAARSPTAFYWPRIQMLCSRPDALLHQSARVSLQEGDQQKGTCSGFSSSGLTGKVEPS